ncbi:MAG: 2-C-methyl-D-erythritol 4-phosphate cytidylyltransferase [Lishizhenia sp.]
MQKSIIITAGGIGKRMGAKVPKQFLKVGDTPILYLTLKRFYDFDSSAQLIITLPEDWIDFWKELVKGYPKIEHTLISGGIERYDSIKNALAHCTGEIIAVHDGVRPFVAKKTLENVFTLALEKGAAIPTLPLKESLRKLDNTKSSAVERALFVSVQTPQVFKRTILEKAYALPFTSEITDDASLVEKSGSTVYLTAGNEENIKITSPLDLKMAEFLIEKEH